MQNSFIHLLLQIVLGLLLFTGLSCKEKKAGQQAPASNPQSGAFGEGVATGRLSTNQTDEASGLAVSRHTPGAMWTHNDHGNKNKVFLLHQDGTLLAEFQLKGKKNRDWEDMAAATVGGSSYLYVCDCGDNDKAYDTKYIYRFAEPKVTAGDQKTEGEIDHIETISFRYPDGQRDSETLLVDASTGDIYLVTKQEDRVTLYMAPYPQSTSEVIELKKVGDLPFSKAVGGDISADGSEVLIKNYKQVFYWKKQGSESIAELLKKQPQTLPYKPEPQGEAIAWTPDGSGYYTLSESPKGQQASIYFYKRN